jgi:DNA helicase-2/ATP-dependent DNA helicase PcrA
MANLGRFNTILTDYETAAMLGGTDRNWSRDASGLFEYIKGHATGAYSEQIGEDLRGSMPSSSPPSIRPKAWSGRLCSCHR